MLKPHWLDEVFAKHENYTDALINASQFKEGMKKAKAAYDIGKAEQKPGVYGASPEQQARQAFLEAMQLQVTD